MAQERILLATADGLRIERVRFHATPTADWSPVYAAPETRLVIPGQGALQLRSSGLELWADELTVFSVSPDIPYQLQAAEAGSARDSVVVSGAARAHGAPTAWLLAPAAMLRLRLQWRAFARRAAQPGEVAALVAGCVSVGRALRVAPIGPLARARRLMREDAACERLPLAAIADAVAASPFQLARLFRRELGCSPHQYRLRLRLAQALARLEAGERDIAGLAHDLGFSSQSHFGALFRREAGMTPAQARGALNG